MSWLISTSGLGVGFLKVEVARSALMVARIGFLVLPGCHFLGHAIVIAPAPAPRKPGFSLVLA